jgi:phosphoribosylformimino-5-aminoimidazole carboxamide ribotide isomerase
MRIVPAVDIRGGRCVNLVQGDYDQETVFSEDPVAQACAWRDAGAELVHIVDLDGALEGRLCAGDALREMTARGVAVEVGGGIRTLEAVDEVFAAGSERVILGTAAYRKPDFLRQATAKWPGKIVVGIDAREGRVALSGWREITDSDAVEFAKFVEGAGASRIIYTDILSDGMMQGLNVEMTRKVAASVAIPVTASGGVSRLQDIENLALVQEAGIDEVIVGRALYVGAFSLEEALELTREMS